MLVLEHEFYFSIQLGIIIPTDFHIFQRGRYTTNQNMFCWPLVRVPDLIIETPGLTTRMFWKSTVSRCVFENPVVWKVVLLQQKYTMVAGNLCVVTVTCNRFLPPVVIARSQLVHPRVLPKAEFLISKSHPSLSLIIVNWYLEHMIFTFIYCG